jgi:nitrogen-specific signal transduction histidine kinase
MPDRLPIPEKLYGRESEIHTLLASFDRVAAGGRPELVLVSGPSGIGKTAVVNELHKALSLPRGVGCGLFVSGEIEPSQRGIPYAAFAQALRYHIHTILTKNDDERARWRDAIRAALGPDDQLLVGLVPELKLIVGEPLPVPDFPPCDAQHRCNLALQRLLAVFTREHPLALFIDDLQWLDAATLDLIEALLTRGEVEHLMLIGAYRDDGISATHPLKHKLDAIRQTGAIVHDIVLAPLTHDDLTALIEDSLHCKETRAGLLAGFIEEKTAGNPFFVIQLISALAEESLLIFDDHAAQWTWDLHRIRARGLGDNLADLLAERLKRLSTEARVSGAKATIAAPTVLLDLSTAIGISHVLSSEIVLPKLNEKLVQTAVEHAGAGRGLLILMEAGPRGGEPRIEAEARSSAGNIEVVLRQAPVTGSDLPQAVLHHVMRTGEHLLLDDASTDAAYAADDYVRQNGSRSLLCLPIIRQAMPIGALYLENDQARGVFTSERVALLQLLVAQAAISLENAALYTDLQRSEAFLAHGQRISHTGSFGWSVASGEFYWSEENYRILEYDRSAPASVDLTLQRMHPDDRYAVRRALEEAIADRKDFDGEHRLLMPDGRVKYVSTSGRAVSTGNLDFVGAVRDITEHKLGEEALRHALTDLARINRTTTMGELMASLAHEINQPITAVVAYANACLRWLDRDKPNLNEARAAIMHIADDGQRAARIFSRIRAQFEKGALNREVFDVGEILRETVDLMSGEAARYDISIRLELAAELPHSVGDRVQLQQVAMNLIVNGFEAMKDMSGRREMLIKTQRVGNEILVSVSDTGRGVPAQFTEQIFDPFFTTKPHGTGMGLRISRSIVESHGGKLWIATDAKHGAIFQFTLPVGAQSGVRNSAQSSPQNSR